MQTSHANQSFDESNLEGRMSAIAELVRQRLAEEADFSFETAIAAVRQTFYRDYSLWDAEFNYVERVVTRTLAAAAKQNQSG